MGWCKGSFWGVGRRDWKLHCIRNCFPKRWTQQTLGTVHTAKWTIHSALCTVNSPQCTLWTVEGVHRCTLVNTTVFFMPKHSQSPPVWHEWTTHKRFEILQTVGDKYTTLHCSTGLEWAKWPKCSFNLQRSIQLKTELVLLLLLVTFVGNPLGPLCTSWTFRYLLDL